jgi:hypothetical protein
VSNETIGTILVLDPSCAQAHGHHLNSLIDLQNALAPNRLEVVVNRAMPAGVLPPEMNAQPLFAATIYDEPGLGPRPNGRIARRLWKVKRWLQSVRAASGKPASGAANEDQAWSAWRTKWPELEQVLTRVVHAPVRHIVVPSSDVELICGLIDLRAQMPLLAQSRIHARLISLTPQIKLLSSQAEATPAYRARIEARMTGVHLYVETPAMQRHFATNFGLASDVYPYLLSPPAFHPAAHGGTAAFGYFGGKRNEKGFSRLVPILEQVAARLSPGSVPLSFFIHASDVRGKEAKSLRDTFAALAAPGLAITFVAGPLESADYNRRFAETDVALLPYTGARYALSGSGIASEALAMGKALIYAQGMSCADFCGPENAIAAGDNTSFANAILDMARNIDRYRAGAASRAQSYQAQVGACVLLKRIK